MEFTSDDVFINDEEAVNILSQLNESTFLGKGANGNVYKITYKNRSVAVKVPVSINTRPSLEKELVIYKHLCKIFDQCYCRDNIVQMLGYNDKHLIIIIEYFDGADLAIYLNYPISEVTFYTHRLMSREYPGDADYATLTKFLGVESRDSIILHMFSIIYNGISCLHSKRIIHRDFQLKNILIRSDGKIAISDFGGSRIVEKGVTFDDYSGLIAGFLADLQTLGPMMGNFVDSGNDMPFQMRYEKLTDTLDMRDLLYTITDIQLQDLFFLCIDFPEVLSFVSFILYCNQNTDLDFGTELVDKAISDFNDTIQSDNNLEESEKEYSYILEIDREYMLTNMYNFIEPGDSTIYIITFFRKIVDSIVSSVINDRLVNIESVNQGLLRIFEPNEYIAVIKTLRNQIVQYGYLFKNFNLFKDTYMI